MNRSASADKAAAAPLKSFWLKIGRKMAWARGKLILSVGEAIIKGHFNSLQIAQKTGALNNHIRQTKSGGGGGEGGDRHRGSILNSHPAALNSIPSVPKKNSEETLSMLPR